MELGETEVTVRLTLNQMQLIAAALEAAGETVLAFRIESSRRNLLKRVREREAAKAEGGYADAFDALSKIFGGTK